MRTPRGDDRHAVAICSAVRSPPATSVNKSSSIAVRSASVRSYALTMSKNSAGDGLCRSMPLLLGTPKAATALLESALAVYGASLSSLGCPAGTPYHVIATPRVVPFFAEVTMRTLTAGVLVLVAVAAALAAGPDSYHLLKTIPVPGDGGWDYVSIDAAGRRVYVSHGTQVDVLDADRFDIVGRIPDTAGVHGIAIASDLGRGFTSNGRANMVTVFDLKS